MLSLKDRVKALHKLPPMPDTASKILNLRSMPEVKVEQIISVIEKDPVLVAQIISYANSAFFGQTGSVKSLKDAIFRVLGVDTVMNMALALSVGSTFNIPQNGPIGAKAIWKSSIYTAALMQRLSMLMPWGDRPNPGTAYLVGLLHDIGFFVLGHLFRDEYESFNMYLVQHADEDILIAEQKVLGITHVKIGKMVMLMWNMPDELIAATVSPDESKIYSDHKKYSDLLTIVKCLLGPHGLAFGNSDTELPVELLKKLKLDEEDVIVAADEVLSEGDIIKHLAKQMCA
jgi:HD-like signal output (HDOD) protein